MEEIFLSKAKRNLILAKYCVENGFYDASANRAYYAAFQAAIAALANQGIKREDNDHKWVQASFSGELIKRRKIYPQRLKSFLSDMLGVRNDADYSIRHVSKKIALRQFSKAEDFVETIVQELSQ
jgi:uncharacterized protein (UPF0332 family)